MNKDKTLQIIEENRKQIHRLVDEKFDSLIQRITNTDELTVNQSMYERHVSLVSEPSAFKGMKPVSVILPDGEEVITPTWKKAALAVLQDCNSNAFRHEMMMRLRGSVAGRFRIILGSDPSKMDVPLKIDNDLYFEGKFDTEYLIKMMTERVLKPTGYEYSGVVIHMRNPPLQNAGESEYESEQETEDENEDSGFIMQM